jgi:hypothetical protein
MLPYLIFFLVYYGTLARPHFFSLPRRMRETRYSTPFLSSHTLHRCFSRVKHAQNQSLSIPGTPNPPWIPQGRSSRARRRRRRHESQKSNLAFAWARVCGGAADLPIPIHGKEIGVYGGSVAVFAGLRGPPGSAGDGDGDVRDWESRDGSQAEEEESECRDGSLQVKKHRGVFGKEPARRLFRDGGSMIFPMI